MKKRLDRLELREGVLRDFVARFRPRGRIKWSLSDVNAWMSEATFHDLLREISRRGAPGSRLCARYWAARYSIPDGLRPHLRRLETLCDALDRDDNSIFYRFEVAEYGSADAT